MSKLKIFLAENFFVIAVTLLFIILAFTMYNVLRKPRNQAPEIARALIAAAEKMEAQKQTAKPETTETPVVPITPTEKTNEPC